MILTDDTIHPAEKILRGVVYLKTGEIFHKSIGADQMFRSMVSCILDLTRAASSTAFRF